MSKFPDHYAALGVPAEATAAEIKAAYRKLVLQHHPDRSSDARSKEIFLRVTEAYEVLSDADRKQDYDSYRDFLKTQDEAAQARRVQEGVAKVRAAQAAEKAAKEAKSPVTLDDRNRLSGLLSKGRLSDAEALALALLQKDGRFGLGYAVLGDLARLKGDIRAASKHYAYAVQFEPGNLTFQQRYEETLGQIPVREVDVRRAATGLEISVTPIVVGGVLVLCAAGGAVSLTERPILPMFPPISTWTMGLMGGLFIAGLVLGLTAAVSGALEKFSALVATAGGGASPVLSLGMIGLANYWLAVAVYLVVGTWQNAFSNSLTRLLTGVGASTTLFALMGGLSDRFDMGQVIGWGGNLCLLGALCGWAVADGFRRR